MQWSSSGLGLFGYHPIAVDRPHAPACPALPCFRGHAISAATAAFLGAPLRLLIDGHWVDAQDGQTLATRDPATDQFLAEVALGGAADIDLAVSAARRAFDDPWSRLGHPGRAALLTRLARLVAEQAELFTELEVLDNGMTRAIAALTVANVVEMFEYYAGAAWRIEGTTTTPSHHVSAQAEALTYTLGEPLGVAGLIVPWNVPLSTAVLKIAPALAAAWWSSPRRKRRCPSCCWAGSRWMQAFPQEFSTSSTVWVVMPERRWPSTRASTKSRSPAPQLPAAPWCMRLRAT